MKNPYRPVWLVWIVAVLPLAGVFFSPVGVSPAARTWLVGLSAALLALAAAGLQVRKAWTRGRALCCGGLALLVAVSVCFGFQRRSLSQLTGGEGLEVQMMMLRAPGVREVWWLPGEGALTVQEEDEAHVVVSGGELEETMERLEGLILRNYRLGAGQEDSRGLECTIRFTSGERVSFYGGQERGWRISAGAGGWLPGYWEMERPLSELLDPRVLELIDAEIGHGGT